MPRTRRGSAVSDRPNSTPPSDNPSVAAQYDITVDLKLAGGINADIWAMLFDGTFVLGVRCPACNRVLTSGKSKAAGIGPKCAARGHTHATGLLDAAQPAAAEVVG